MKVRMVNWNGEEGDEEIQKMKSYVLVEGTGQAG